MENTENYEIIGAEEFLRRLYAGEEIKDIKVDEDVFIDAYQMRGNPINVKSGKFSNFQIFSTVESAKLIHMSILWGDFDCFKILENVRINKLVIYSGIFTDFTISGAKIDYFIINGGLFEISVIERTKLLNTTVNFGDFPNFTIDNADFGTFIIKKGEFGDFTLSSGIFKIFKVLGGSFSDFVIEDGKFDELEISNGELDIFEMHAGLFLNFRINKCKSTNCFSIKGGEFTGTFTITGEFQNFYINGGEYSCRTCFIIGCTFNFFEISDGNFKNILQIGVEGINSMLFEDKARFIGGIFRTLLFCGGKFKNGLMLSNNIKIQENCKFLGGEYIKPISLNAGIDVSNLIFYFNKNLLVGQIQFSTSFAVKNTYFENNENLLPNLLFENCAIPTGTLIKINETYIENITFINSVNFGNIVFSGVKGTKNKETKQSTLKINNSDLGKTTFIDCDFEEMELDFRSSKITEVFLAGTKMPLKIKEELNEKKELNLDQQRLGYGQLKKIYENRGDTVSANDYFAKEMNVVYSQTSWNWKVLGEKILLISNKYSSNHGTSWTRAFWATIIVASIFFMFYGWSIGLSCISWLDIYEGKWDLIFNYPSYFLEFINPLHKPNFIVEEMESANKVLKIPNSDLKTTNLSRIIENISAIFITYFIYQLIQAFRKHKKSST